MVDMIKVRSKLDRRMMDMIVFPIIKALFYPEGVEVHKIIGTGFFLDENGIFLSARHIFQGRGSALDKEYADGFAVYCVHAVNFESKYVVRYIDINSIKTREDTDVAIGKVETNQFGRPNKNITEDELKKTAHLNYVSGENVAVGTKIFTVAHPLTDVSNVSKGRINIDVRSKAYEGRITKHHPVSRDAGLISWPCYETDMEVKGGASGGPVFLSGKDGVIFAINCTGTDPHMFSHVSSLAPIIS